MTHKSTLIIWQKWVDPFGADSEESKWTDYTNDSPPINTSLLDEDEKDIIPQPNKSVKVIASPMGLIPYNEHTASGKIFNFWTGHTNFDITKQIVDIIDLIEGVETLDIFTRYRFRIGIGKCFEDSSVMSEINQTIQNFLKQNI
jgi:hypothetical protein